MASIYYPLDDDLTYVAIEKQEDHYELTVVQARQKNYIADTSLFPSNMYAINLKTVRDSIFRLIKPTYQDGNS